MTIIKVHIFWEGHKKLRNLPLTFLTVCTFSKKLWPAQNIWNLIGLEDHWLNFCFSLKYLGPPALSPWFRRPCNMFVHKVALYLLLRPSVVFFIVLCNGVSRKILQIINNKAVQKLCIKCLHLSYASMNRGVGMSKVFENWPSNVLVMSKILQSLKPNYFKKQCSSSSFFLT